MGPTSTIELVGDVEFFEERRCSSRRVQATPCAPFGQFSKNRRGGGVSSPVLHLDAVRRPGA